MKGGCDHSPYVATPADKGWEDRLTGATVIVQNDGDPHYWQGFESWDELNKFIEDLKQCGLEAFGQIRD